MTNPAPEHLHTSAEVVAALERERRISTLEGEHRYLREMVELRFRQVQEEQSRQADTLERIEAAVNTTNGSVARVMSDQGKTDGDLRQLAGFVNDLHNDVSENRGDIDGLLKQMHERSARQDERRRVWKQQYTWIAAGAGGILAVIGAVGGLYAAATDVWKAIGGG